MVASTTPEGQACAVLQPAVAEAARRAGATAVRLVDLVGGPRPGTARDLELDRVLTTYGDGRALGDPGASTRLTCRVVGDLPVPATTVPPVVGRHAVPLGRDLEARLAATLDACAGPDGDVLTVVLTAWALARVPRARRQGVVDVLLGAARPPAWVSVEGVGVAPGVPTLGDRPASGHSLVSVALVGDGRCVPEVVARCWSRGAVLAWLAAAGEGAGVSPS